MKDTKHQLHGIKRVISAAMAVAVAASAFTMPAMAEQYGVVDGAVSKEWDGSVAASFDGGTGTKADPYLIATGEQLALLAQNVDNGTTYEGSYFTLTADILLNDDVDYEPNEWNSIGDQYKVECAFGGTFDGANHRVIGLYQNGSDSQGLFGCNFGTVKNVSVTDGKIENSDCSVGAVCGTNDNKGILSNCYSDVKITTASPDGGIGGVCGYNHSEISNCHNSGELYITGGVSSDYLYDIGGVCGYNNFGTISDSSNTGRVYTTSSYVNDIGGICGTNLCGTINNCYNTGEVNGYRYTGGICGTNSEGTVKDCYNSGEITGRYEHVGGICGRSYSDNATDVILRCYNKGDIINAYTNYGGGNTGGICGYIDGCLISQCYNTANVTSYYSGYGAGICGYAAQGKISECYNSGFIKIPYNNIGGIAGYLNSNCVIENCYNTGAVDGKAFVGGVWGASNNSSTNSMTNCYNAGPVSGISDTVFPVGENEGQISNVYYNSDVCTDSSDTNSGWAKTTAQLTASTAISDLGFEASKWSKTTNTSVYRCYPDLTSLSGDHPRAISGIDAPTGVTAVADNRRVNLQWDAVENATQYVIYRSTDNSTYERLAGFVAGTSYTATRLTNGTKYYFKVQAYGSGAWSSLSSAASATPVGSMTAPTNLTAAAGDGKVTLGWTAPSGATQYAVYYSKDNSTYTRATASATGTSYTVTGLTNGITYFFKLKAYGNGVWSELSEAVSATPKAALTAPTNLTAAAGNGQVTLDWTAPAGATQYAIYSSTDNVTYKILTANATGTSYTVTGLTNGTTYFFKLKAYGSGVWTGFSDAASATPVGTLTAPTNIKAAAGNGKVTLTWTAPSGATQYAVYYSKNNSTYTRATANATGTSYTVTGLTNGTTYFFKLKSYGSGVWSGLSDAVSATPTGALTAPTNIKAAAGNGSVTLTWTAPAGATQYAIYSSTDGSTYKLLTASATGTSYTATGLTNGTKYYFKLKSYGNGAWSALSGAVSATPVATMSAPTNIKATAGNAKVTLSWTAPSGATQYAIYYSTDNAAYKLITANATGTSYTATGLTNGTKYYFKLKAYGSGVWTGLSDAVSATPTA